MAEKAYYTYILACADGTFYTGWTTDVAKRVATHNRGKGAKYTRSRLPVRALATWRFQNQSEAMRFERWLKTLPRAQKARLAAEPMPTGLPPEAPQPLPPQPQPQPPPRARRSDRV